ncbi:MAG: hypothetical protein AB7U62_04055 [Pseudolabrys sp.]
MGWDAVQERNDVSPKHDAEVRNVCRAKAKRPSLQVTLRGDLVRSLNWASGIAVGLLVGTGEHAGRIRLLHGAQGGIAKARRIGKGSTLCIDFGYVKAFADSFDGGPCRAQVIDNAVELELPARDDDGDADEASQPTASPTLATKPVTAAPKAVKPKAPGTLRTSAPAASPVVSDGTVFELQGVAVNTTREEETVSHAGRVMDLTGRQAQFVIMMLRAAPTPVAKEFVRDRLFGDAKAAGVQLDLLASDLQKGLVAVGLDMHVVKGVGYTLRKV